jgi:hypothetical protein
MKSLTLAGICTLSIITLSNCASSPTAALKDLQTAQGSRVRPNTESAAKDAPIKTLSGKEKVDFDLTTEGVSMHGFCAACQIFKDFFL